VAAYDPAGVSGDARACECVDEDYAAFQTRVTLCEILALQNGADEDMLAEARRKKKERKERERKKKMKKRRTRTKTRTRTRTRRRRR
jgi:hypothetical protein